MKIGSNYLCGLGSRPESVGSNIENLVSLLHHQCGAAFVIVCQVIHRKRLPAHCPHYNANVYLLNKYLRVVLEPLTYAEFWCHKGLREPNIPVLRRDGIHLNNAGNYTPHRSYRGSILVALGQIS